MSMLDLPLVTIITVCRNAEATIAHTLRSVAEQTYAPIEYIVVDGASTDATLELVKACLAVTRWVSEPDDGIADAFNKGIALASGEWIGILNADDWYEPETVATIVRAGERADVVHGPIQFWDNGVPHEIYYPRQERLRLEMTVNHPSVFVRKSLYERLGSFDARYRYAMDYELMLRFWVAGARFRTVERILANMRYGGVSDARWARGVLECARAKTALLGTPLAARAYCLWQLSRGGARRALERMGMRRAVQAFRRHFSLLEKA